MSKKAAKRPESPADLVLGVFEASLKAIRKEINAIAAGKVLVGNTDPVIRIAILASKAAAIAGEQRKIAKAEANEIRKLTPAVVVAWVRMQTPEYRARLVREVVAIDATERRSVLG